MIIDGYHYPEREEFLNEDDYERAVEQYEDAVDMAMEQRWEERYADND